MRLFGRFQNKQENKSFYITNPIYYPVENYTLDMLYDSSRRCDGTNKPYARLIIALFKQELMKHDRRSKKSKKFKITPQAYVE